MKILFIINSLQSGGKERRLVELIKNLSSNEHIEMELIVTKEKIVYTDIFLTGIKIHYACRKNLKKDPRLFLKFFRITKKFKPDVIHVWGKMEALYALPTKILLGIPMLNSQITNSMTIFFKDFLNQKLIFPLSDMILSNSYAGLKAYDAPKNKSKVIYNGFDFRRLYNLEDKGIIRNKLNIESSFIVGMVADYTINKDHATFIKAAKEVLKVVQDVVFICVGSGDFEIYKQMIETKYEENIIFLGHEKNIESIMNICDIGVLTTYTEGISNSLLEFMALGKPLVVSGEGGCSEIVKNEYNGYLYNIGDYNGVAKGILSLLQKKKLRLKFGERSEIMVREKFSMDVMKDAFMNEYKLLIDKN